MPRTPVNTWSSEQLANANAIIRVGQSVGASQRDIIVALMAAMQESGLRNLNYGDRDSIGLFQQRNAWGSTAERLNPESAARMFFLGGHAGQRGLLDPLRRVVVCIHVLERQPERRERTIAGVERTAAGDFWCGGEKGTLRLVRRKGQQR